MTIQGLYNIWLPNNNEAYWFAITRKTVVLPLKCHYRGRAYAKRKE